MSLEKLLINDIHTCSLLKNCLNKEIFQCFGKREFAYITHENSLITAEQIENLTYWSNPATDSIKRYMGGFQLFKPLVSNPKPAATILSFDSAQSPTEETLRHLKDTYHITKVFMLNPSNDNYGHLHIDCLITAINEINSPRRPSFGAAARSLARRFSSTSSLPSSRDKLIFLCYGEDPFEVILPSTAPAKPPRIRWKCAGCGSSVISEPLGSAEISSRYFNHGQLPTEPSVLSWIDQQFSTAPRIHYVKHGPFPKAKEDNALGIYYYGQANMGTTFAEADLYDGLISAPKNWHILAGKQIDFIFTQTLENEKKYWHTRCVPQYNTALQQVDDHKLEPKYQHGWRVLYPFNINPMANNPFAPPPSDDVAC